MPQVTKVDPELLVYWRTFPAPSNEVLAADLIEGLQRELAEATRSVGDMDAARRWRIARQLTQAQWDEIDAKTPEDLDIAIDAINAAPQVSSGRQIPDEGVRPAGAAPDKPTPRMAELFGKRPMSIEPQYVGGTVSGQWVKDWQEYAEALQRELAEAYEARARDVAAVQRAFHNAAGASGEITAMLAEVEATIKSEVLAGNVVKEAHARGVHVGLRQAAAAQPSGAGATCATCGFRYWEYQGHIIPCPRCESIRE